MRALSEAEANQVLQAAFDASLSFSSGSLGGNQPLGGKFANARSRLPMDDAQFGKVLDDALLLSNRIFGFLAASGNCLTQTPGDPVCAEEQLQHFARLLWRGNVKSESFQPLVDRFVSLTGEADAQEAVVQVFAALLLSPEFLYRFEFGSPAAAGGLELAPLELAENLAFFVTGRPPSTALLTAAETGQLAQEAGFDAQLRALLDSHAAGAQFASIIAQLLDYRTTAAKGNANSTLTPDVAAQMVAETDAYLELAYAQDWSIAQILSSKVAPVSPGLVDYYEGLPFSNAAIPPASHEFASEKRFGLLTQGSVLVGLADPNKVAIVHRGRVLRERVLCRGVPPPPANVQNALPPPLPDQTERERVTVHRSHEACRQCHAYLDGIGFALDSFGNDGRFRVVVPTNDGASSKPVDTSGALEGVSAGTVQFADTAEFFAWLSVSEDAASCLTSSFVEYAQGTNALPAGECGDAAAFLAQAPQLGVKQLVARITRDRFFRSRAEQ